MALGHVTERSIRELNPKDSKESAGTLHLCDQRPHEIGSLLARINFARTRPRCAEIIVRKPRTAIEKHPAFSG